MKKVLLSVFILGSFGVYVLSQTQDVSSSLPLPTQSVSLGRTSTQDTSSSNSNSIPTSSSSSVATTTTSNTSSNSNSSNTSATNTSAPVTVPKKTGEYTDGTYTGPSEDAYYGNVQVQVTIANGKIADVQFLDYPQDRSYSRSINSQAMPYLTQEAISAQSANVNGFSGASDTSAAFRQSLAAALSQAKA